MAEVSVGLPHALRLDVVPYVTDPIEVGHVVEVAALVPSVEPLYTR